MDQLEQPQPTRTETRHFNIAVSLGSLRTQEQRLAALGQRDERATEIFQGYHLPGQEFIREQEDGERVKVVRGLVDPEEYAILVNKNNGGAQLLRVVGEDQKASAEGWKKIGLEGEPPLYSSLEIIVGNIDAPETCYRYKVLDVHTTNNPAEVVVTVKQNVEHEKEKGEFIPFGVLGGEEKSDPKEETSNLDTTPSSMVVVSNEGFTDSQKELMEKDNLPPNLAFGKRTRNLIAHQRAPQGMTRFADDVVILKIDLQKNLWVVAVSGDAVEAHYKTLRK